ncbi:MAG: hypothetical protein Q8P17_02070 [bacterium]|nr:hypothetical protein [bacterium]
MLITITVVSILVIAGLVWFANRVLPFTVCPICAGVFLTWVWLITAYTIGYQINLVIPALLMGGSVVGVAYQLEKKFKDLPAGRILLWKVLFIPAGFVAAYSILEQLSVEFLLATVFLFLISFVLLSSKSNTTGSRSETVGDIEKKMEDCC